MKLLRTKVWYWWDIALLKWSVLLFGMIFGALFADIVKDNVWWFLMVAVLVAIRPGIAYFKE
jgi:hypothetical protein